jgi:mycothiol synthase
VTAGVGLRWRAIGTADAPAWCELLAAVEAADRTGEHYDVDDVLEELTDPDLDAERDTVAAYDGARMVAYGLVRGGGGEGTGVDRQHVEGCVHPGYRRTGLGTEVLRRGVERARERRGQHLPGELLTRVHDANEGAAALFTTHGFEAVRWFYDMHRDLARAPEPITIPDGLRLVGDLDATRNPELDEAVRLAHNEAFTDHWGSQPRNAASWRQWFTGSRWYRPRLSFALLDGDEVAGYALSYEYEADYAATGVREAWIGQLGTRRRWRGRGVATALLRQAMRAYAEAGFERAALGVDTANPTGALGLYQRVGFTPSARWVTYRRPL